MCGNPRLSKKHTLANTRPQFPFHANVPLFLTYRLKLASTQLTIRRSTTIHDLFSWNDDAKRMRRRQIIKQDGRKDPRHIHLCNDYLELSVLLVLKIKGKKITLVPLLTCNLRIRKQALAKRAVPLYRRSEWHIIFTRNLLKTNFAANDIRHIPRLCS